MQELNHLLPPIDGDTRGRAAPHFGLVRRHAAPGAEGPFRHSQAACHQAVARMAAAALGRFGHSAAEVLFLLATSRLAMTGTTGTRVAMRIDRVARRLARPDLVRTDVRTGHGRWLEAS